MKIESAFGWMGPDPVDIIVTNRCAATTITGALLMLDQRRTDGDSTSNTPGIALSGVANVITPVATVVSDLSAGIFGIGLNGAVDNAIIRLRLRGFVDFAQMQGTVVLATDDSYGAVTATRELTKLAPQAAPQTNASFPKKVLFIPLTARTGAGLTNGWFDGISGFGIVNV